MLAADKAKKEEVWYSHASNSYIPQMEQGELEEQMLFHLENVTYLLDVTPSNPLSHPSSPPPIPLCVIQDLVAKQHSTNRHTASTQYNV